MISNVSELNSIAMFKVNQTAGVARVGFCDTRRCVSHRETLELCMIVKLDTKAVYIVVIRINDLTIKFIEKSF